MEITVNVTDLKNAISFANNFIEKSPIVEIAENIFLEVDVKSQRLKINATSIQEGGSVNIDLRETKDINENISFLLPKRTLNVLKTIEEPDISIHFKENGNSISQVTFKTESSTFKFEQNVESDEFPIFEKIDNVEQEINVNLETIQNSLKEVAFAKSKSSNGQAALENVFLEVTNNNLKLIATNTYCLSYVSLKKEFSMVNDVSFFITPNIIKAINKLDAKDNKELKIKLIGNGKDILKIYYQYEDLLFFNQNINGKFPNYNLVLETREPYKTEIDIVTKNIKNPLKRVKALLTIQDDTDVIKLQVNEKNVSFVRQINSDEKTIEENLDLEYQKDKDLGIYISIDYLSDFINNINEKQFKIRLNKALNPLILEANNEERIFKGLIMPVRSH